MTLGQMKARVAEITQLRITSLKNGSLGDFWITCFRDRHLDLVLRVLQGLNHKRAGALNPQIVAQFYINVESFYNEHHYDSSCIWNIDESRCQALQNGLAKVFTKRGLKRVQKVILVKREWLSVFSTINANGETILHYYIFKGVRHIRNYVAYCEEDALLGMQRKS